MNHLKREEENYKYSTSFKTQLCLLTIATLLTFYFPQIGFVEIEKNSDLVISFLIHVGTIFALDFAYKTEFRYKILRAILKATKEK